MKSPLLFSALFAALVCAVTAAGEIKLTSYDYSQRNESLVGRIDILNIAYSKQVSILYADYYGKWGRTCSAGYDNGPDPATNIEVWKFNCPIGLSGVSQFYLRYLVDGKTYTDDNNGQNYTVTSDPPTPTPPPPPFGSTGFQPDITDWLNQGLPYFQQHLFDNVNPPTGLPGVIVASSPNSFNNYQYHWVRDAALVTDVIQSLYARGNSSLEKYFYDFANFTNIIQQIQGTPGSLGEAKYEINGTGPAFRASSFIRFANTYLAQNPTTGLALVQSWYNGTDMGIIKRDLEYTTQNLFDANGCDPWEETRGIHFFVLAAQRKSLIEGAALARKLGDVGAAEYYELKAKELEPEILSFFDPNLGTLITTRDGRQLDSALPLAVLRTNMHEADGLFKPNSPQVLSTIYELSLGFMDEFKINRITQTDSNGLPLSVAIGRYYSDLYDGSSGVSRGNPWFLTTATVGELVYKASTLFLLEGSITTDPLTHKFLTSPTPSGLGLSLPLNATFAKDSLEFKRIIRHMQAHGDKHLRRVKAHHQDGFRISEQFERETGVQKGVSDLTWSYASVLSAWFAREELKELTGDGKYGCGLKQRR
ncbi:glycoside hydrolase 15 protein [Chytridiales sp. JEL 0842]|nr:glycoside hydrolase 15 protein [Chytridiales sp. JEL 0842]